MLNLSVLSRQKNLLTNGTALLLIVLGYCLPGGQNWLVWRESLITMGIFAFSGAITNWLAIYMLFEKIPFLYGSGVIPAQFGAFKISIKKMIMQQFFNREHVEKTLVNHCSELLVVGLNHFDYEKLYQALVDSILSSQFGSMINMFGGPQILESLKPAIIEKLKAAICDVGVNELLEKLNDDGKLTTWMQDKIEDLIDNRLEQLTPQLVKQIIQDMIKQHMGWLIVWGGVFGGAIGLGFNLLNYGLFSNLY